MRRYLDAFAGGMNACVQQHPDKISDEVEGHFTDNGWMSHIQRLVHFTFFDSIRY